jgi:hypothetical protein
MRAELRLIMRSELVDRSTLRGFPYDVPDYVLSQSIAPQGTVLPD